MNITILTPAYNRRYIIERLYDSLIRQTSSNFEWLIVDDGSEDHLAEWVENVKKENKIKIRYIY